ncbi:hypothetical protein APHNP_0365 [Anaplasma phagocytophilum str. ApNP]|uniref:Uncharacterized protein n=1 Tax=Anaplasma phagocytophilum str. ApNP TaxID=1359153 RepID=A0A0F3NF88_ANAPH|nr:hypothetical protein APHNP_0365 [Anaplasma phagocytophilum str. ApNP]
MAVISYDTCCYIKYSFSIVSSDKNNKGSAELRIHQCCVLQLVMQSLPKILR